MDSFDNDVDWWTPHGSEFAFKWSGQRLFYRGKATDATRVWEPSSQHLTNMLPTKDAVLRFVRNGLESPDANTVVTFSAPTSEIAIAHASPLLPAAKVVVSGIEMSDMEEKMRFTMERVDAHQSEIKTLAGETSDLRDSVAEIQETLRKLDEELKFTIARLGGEKAVVVRGYVMDADYVQKDRGCEGGSYLNEGDCRMYFNLSSATPVCLKAIKPMYLNIFVKMVESELRVSLFGGGYTEIGSFRDVLEDIRDEIKELRIYFYGAFSSSLEFKFPCFPKLVSLTLQKVPFKNTDYLDNIAKSCKVHVQ